MALAIRVCANCGAVLQDPAPHPDVMVSYYKNYSNYTNTSRNGLPDSHSREASNRQISVIKQMLKPSRVFEVGCATGWMLSELKSIGWEVTGCDPSPTAARVAFEQRGIEIHAGTFEDIKLEVEQIDLVIISHVLEHLYSPVSSLKKAHLMLAPEGHILVEVPCLINPETWPNGYFTFEHINIFTEKTLINCLKQVGFIPVLVQVITDSPHYPVVLILGKKMPNETACQLDVDSPAKVQGLIDIYLEVDSSEWIRINRLLEIELKGIDSVVIWGGGIHTSQLLENTVTLKTKNIDSIIDSDPQKHGLELGGVKICAPGAVNLNEKTIAVVISSRASESEIYMMLSNRRDVNAKIICLYQ